MDSKEEKIYILLNLFCRLSPEDKEQVLQEAEEMLHNDK